MQLDIEKSLKEAQTLIQAGDNDDARMLLLEILKIEPNNQAALIILGGAYFSSEKLHEAEMVFERLVLMEPGRGEFSIALFNTLWRQQRQEEAIEEIRRFLAVADKEKERQTIEQYIAITKQISGE